MKLLLLKGILSFIFVQMIDYSFAQTITQQLNPEEIANRVAHVHGSAFVLNNPTLVTAFGELMTNRIEFKLETQGPDEKFPLLSTVPLSNKTNSAIQGADFANFNVNTFNPLVYNLEFFSNRTQVFRIDNTNYLMIVKPNRVN